MTALHRPGAGWVACAVVALFAGCRQPPPPTVDSVPGGDPERGRALVARYGCGGCHTIPGIPAATGGVGPSLAGFASRSFIAGNLRNEPELLIGWIRFPQQVEPGTVMPNLGVTDADSRHIAAFLYTLDARGLGPPHLLPARLLPSH